MQQLRILLLSILSLLCAFSLTAQTVQQRLVLENDQIDDQDDMSLWIHPSDPSQSTIIAADKGADKIFVYDLEGSTLQTLSDDYRPGNIDLRYHFPFGAELIDIVAFNDRNQNVIVVYKIDRTTRLLERIDNREIETMNNYGFCFYRSPQTGKFYGFVTAKNGNIQHFELFEENGQIAGELVRELSVSSQTEACVCDDETGQAYFGEEEEGIWKIGAEPGDGTSLNSIAQVGDDSGLASDVEGLTIYYAANGEGYLIASSQGDNKYTVFERQPPHRPVGNFEIEGVSDTDGIDVANVPLGENFPHGIFMYHNGKNSPYPVGIASWQDIAQSMEGGLMIDTGYWNPSKNQSTSVGSRDEPALQGFTLHQNYPNPFNPMTVINYRLPMSNFVELSIYNLRGQLVRTLVKGQMVSGDHSVVWDATDDAGARVASGGYLAVLRAREFTAQRKLTLIK